MLKNNSRQTNIQIRVIKMTIELDTQEMLNKMQWDEENWDLIEYLKTINLDTEYET